MAQVTLYLDEDTETKMKSAAMASGVSVSRWVANLIREKTAERWPDAVAEMAGSWEDAPEAEELREGEGDDTPREPF